MNATARPIHFLLVLLLAISLVSCSLPSAVTPEPVKSVPTEPPSGPQVLPTSTQVVIPLVTSTPVPPMPTTEPTLEPTAIVLPTQVPTAGPTATLLPPTTNIGSYSVVLVASNDVLWVHQTAGANAPTIGSLAFDAKDIMETGKETLVNGAPWVEIQYSGGTGWVNKKYLTEQMPADNFCADPQVVDLLANLKQAISNKDGELFASLISPIHGLNLEYLRGGTVANYNGKEASWVFNSTYSMDWGIHPASGLDVKGSFSSEVLPKLLDVFNASYNRVCSEIVTGGASYTANWPDVYKNVNFLAANRPGAAGDELNWRTWLVGVEYVDGKPYLFSLSHLFWEP